MRMRVYLSALFLADRCSCFDSAYSLSANGFLDRAWKRDVLLVVL